MGIFLTLFHFSATSVLLSKYNRVPALVATSVFSYVSGLLHLAQALLLLKAIKVTQIARQAIGYGNSVLGGGKAQEAEATSGSANTSAATVVYQKDKEIVLDPTQTVY